MPASETCEKCPGVKCINKSWGIFYPWLGWKGRIAQVKTSSGHLRQFEFRSEPIENCPAYVGRMTPEETAELLRKAAGGWTMDQLVGEGPGY